MERERFPKGSEDRVCYTTAIIGHQRIWIWMTKLRTSQWLAVYQLFAVIDKVIAQRLKPSMVVSHQPQSADQFKHRRAGRTDLVSTSIKQFLQRPELFPAEQILRLSNLFSCDTEPAVITLLPCALMQTRSSTH